MISFMFFLRETLLKHTARYIHAVSPSNTNIERNNEVKYDKEVEKDEYDERKTESVSPRKEYFMRREHDYFSSTIDIRLVFADVIDEYYSETGGPSSYDAKLSIMLEDYLLQNREKSWDEKVNREEIKAFVFSNIKKLTVPPPPVDRPTPAERRNQERLKRLKEMKSSNLVRKNRSGLLNLLRKCSYTPTHSKNKRFRRIRKGCSSLFCPCFCRRKKRARATDENYMKLYIPMKDK